MKVIMATNNMDKVREIRQMLEGSDIDIIPLNEAGIDVRIDETGTTFEENAAIKACTVRDLSGQITIADDSGLEIDFFDGAPGIYSSRFMGEDTSYDVKNAAILEKMKDVPDEERGARFVCAMVIAYPDGHEETFKGIFEGRIAYEIKGKEGFGYDPVFYLPDRGCTSAQLSPEEKNAVSHRGQALRKVIEALKSYNQDH